ncbi:MAG TPA: carnitine dehydratase [Desulfobulbaceae bacterium]|nr:carnitine dehydratase [Desulfobulbaceae bacterium]
MTGVLRGIRVLDISRLLPGPYCSMMLADHGAEVIAAEDRKFLADGLFFHDLYRNKRHMSLNLKAAAGREIFLALAAKSDVILEGFRPGVTKRLGVDYEAVRQINPGIIYCSITGYGQTGPDRDLAGHDVNYLSAAGVLDLIGQPGQPPSIPGVQIADIAGGMNAALGIVLALFERGRSGQGQYLDISMTDGLLGFMTLPAILQQRGQRMRRSGHLLSHRYACYSTYATADNRYLSLGGLEPRFWKNLCQGLAVPEYIPLQYDEERREEIIARFRKIFLSKNLAAWNEILTRLDVCYAAVATLDEVFVSPLFTARNMLVRHTHPDGKESIGFASPVRLSLTPATVRSQPVAFGANTRQILAELSYGEKEIDQLFKDGVV